MPENAAEKAIEVTKERMAEYGHPANVHGHVSRLWSAYLGLNLSSRDIALMMVLFKMGREMAKIGRAHV